MSKAHSSGRRREAWAAPSLLMDEGGGVWLSSLSSCRQSAQWGQRALPTLRCPFSLGCPQKTTITTHFLPCLARPRANRNLPSDSQALFWFVLPLLKTCKHSICFHQSFVQEANNAKVIAFGWMAPPSCSRAQQFLDRELACPSPASSPPPTK